MRSRLLVVLLAFSACDSKTQKQVFEELRPAADALRAKVVAAAKVVEKRPPVSADSTCLAPEPLTFDPSSDAHDTDYLMLNEALRGGAKADDQLRDEDLNLYFPTNPLPRVLRGTSTNSLYADYMLTGTADEAFKAMTKRGLHVKHLVLVREYGAALEYFLVDLTAAQPTVICEGTFTPSADPSAEAAHIEAWTTIWKNKRTGKEVRRKTEEKWADPQRATRYTDAVTQFALRMHQELGLSGIE